MTTSLIAAISEGITNASVAAAINVATVRGPISRFGSTQAPERILMASRD